LRTARDVVQAAKEPGLSVGMFGAQSFIYFQF